MRNKIFIGLVALLTLNAIGMNGQKISIDTKRQLPFFAGVERRNISDNQDMKRSYSCPAGLKIDQQHLEKINSDVSQAPVKAQIQKKKQTLTKSNSESELYACNGDPINKGFRRCRSTDSLFPIKTPNPIKRSFACTNLSCYEKSIVFFCIRHCKDKANLNNVTHSQGAFNQFDIKAFNLFEVYLLKMIGELLRPNQVFGGSHSRHSITASLFGWELTQTSSLNEQNLGRLKGLPLSEVVKHHSFQKITLNPL